MDPTRIHDGVSIGVVRPGAVLASNGWNYGQLCPSDRAVVDAVVAGEEHPRVHPREHRVEIADVLVVFKPT